MEAAREVAAELLREQPTISSTVMMGWRRCMRPEYSIQVVGLLEGMQRCFTEYYGHVPPSHMLLVCICKACLAMPRTLLWRKQYIWHEM